MGKCYWTQGDISLWNLFHLCSDDYNCNYCCLRWYRYYIAWSDIWLLALSFSHGMVCSVATGVPARLNLFHDIINGKFFLSDIPL
jgi:hypothetical protein